MGDQYWTSDENALRWQLLAKDLADKSPNSLRAELAQRRRHRSEERNRPSPITSPFRRLGSLKSPFRMSRERPSENIDHGDNARRTDQRPVSFREDGTPQDEFNEPGWRRLFPGIATAVDYTKKRPESMPPTMERGNRLEHPTEGDPPPYRGNSTHNPDKKRSQKENPYRRSLNASTTDEDRLTQFPAPGNLTGEESRTEDEDRVPSRQRPEYRSEGRGGRHQKPSEPGVDKKSRRGDEYSDPGDRIDRDKQTAGYGTTDKPKSRSRPHSMNRGEKKPQRGYREYDNDYSDEWEPAPYYDTKPKRTSRDPDKQKLIDDEIERANREFEKEMIKKKKKKEAMIAAGERPGSGTRPLSEKPSYDSRGRERRTPPPSSHRGSSYRDEDRHRHRDDPRAAKQHVRRQRGSISTASVASSHSRTSASSSYVPHRGPTDSDKPRNKHAFYLTYLAAQLVAALAVILIIFWCVYPGRGNGDPPGRVVAGPANAPNISGFAWKSNPNQMFNLHPFLMVVGFIYLIFQSGTLYRTFPMVSVTKMKYLHAIIMAIAFGCMVVALVAVFTFKAFHDFGNIATIHGLLGIIVAVIFSLQLVIASGIFNIFFATSSQLRMLFKPVHSFFGVVIFFFAVAVSFTGMVEAQTKGFNVSGFLEKFYVMAMMVLCVLVGYILCLQRNASDRANGPTRPNESRPINRYKNKNYSAF